MKKLQNNKKKKYTNKNTPDVNRISLEDNMIQF